MSPTNVNRKNTVHIDLSLIPLRKQVDCIWLSKVIKNNEELQEMTGINLMAIKLILYNKAKILQRWRDGMRTYCKSELSASEKEDHNGIDILLLEWIRCSILNKTVLYEPDIERQAEILKQLFKVPRYRIKTEIWNKIKSLTEIRLERGRLSEFVPHNIVKILKTNGKQLLKHETYLKFSKIISATAHSNEIISDDQSDDLILIENPIECIDVTDDGNITSNNKIDTVKSEQPYSQYPDRIATSYITGEPISDFPKLLPLKLDFGVSNKEESNENGAKSANKFLDVLIKKEIVENYDQTQGSQYKTAINNELSNKINNTLQSKADVDIFKAEDHERDSNILKSELDVQGECIDVAVQRLSGNLSRECEKTQLNIKQELQFTYDSKTGNSDKENEHKIEIEEDKTQQRETTNCIQGGFEILEFGDEETEIINFIDGEIIANNDHNNQNMSITDINTEFNSDKTNKKVTDIVLEPVKRNGESQESANDVDNNDNDDDDGDNADNDYSDTEIEVVYEIEDSNEDMHKELQQIINNYRNKTDKNIDLGIANISAYSSDDEHDEEDTITVLEIISEDDAEYVDEDELSLIKGNKIPHKRKINEAGINVNDKLNDNSFTTINNNSNNNTEKRKKIHNLSHTEDLFDPNLPSTSRLAAANLPSSSSSSLSTTKKPLSFSLPTQKSLHKITLQNDVDVVKYLQHIKKYLLSQNDEHAAELVLNLQMAFISSK